jgi:hypothetical protein
MVIGDSSKPLGIITGRSARTAYRVSKLRGPVNAVDSGSDAANNALV